MEREISEKIVEWNNSRKRKPLILMGARQVGKTWLMKSFAAAVYPKKAVFVNLMKEDGLREALESSDLDPKSVVEIIELKKNVKIVPGETLLVLDEIQESPRALTALKFFNEDMPGLAVMAAGSLLGLSLRKGRKGDGKRIRGSFPVGKVEFLDVRPMSFWEFLRATGEEMKLEKLRQRQWKVVSLAHDDYVRLLKRYFYVGGMPEAVLDYVETGDLHEVRKTQKAILRAYDKDFEKHAKPSLLAKVRLLWGNVAAQLAKENKKFIYTALRTGARAREYEEAIQWLDDAAMVQILRRVAPPRMPLGANADFSAFKLYVHDVGLLGAMSGLRAESILDGSAVFTNFKGAMTEQYVLQELLAAEAEMGYWSSEKGDAEVDFVLQGATEVFPLEAKAARNLKAQSLKAYREFFQPSVCYRTSLEKFTDGKQVRDIPLYGVRSIAEEIADI